LRGLRGVCAGKKERTIMSDSNAGRITPDEALAEIMAGNERYVQGGWDLSDFSASRAATIDEHEPIAAILGCADARVAAELIFLRGPGDLFMVRVVGNFLSEYGLASLEYAVRFLQVPLLIVLGHTQCGALSTAVKIVQERSHLPGRLPYLIDAIEPAVHIAKEKHPEDLLRAAIEENVRRQVQRLTTISPVINEAEADGTTLVVGAVYELETGRVVLVD
jgi:carbonic anhydrase